MISLGVLDIDQQPEVRDFLWEEISYLPEHLRESVHHQSFLLKSKGLECDYHFDDIHFDITLTHLFWHTKTLKASGGDFKDELFLESVLKSLNLRKDTKVFFYSGDIAEFKVHLSWIAQSPLLKSLLTFTSVRCVDVFDLLYPKDDDLGLWLKRTLTL